MGRTEVIARAIWCAHVIKEMSLHEIARDTAEDGIGFDAVFDALNYGYYLRTMDQRRKAMRPHCGKTFMEVR
jgi:hypothetical protein